jgi:hypothetical protein
MVEPVVVLNATLILLVLFTMASYAYLDAPKYGMDPTKWAAISFLVPLFGFFAYIFERDERKPDPDNDRDEMFVDGPFKVHKSRADDVSWVSDPEDGASDSETGDQERG